MNIYDMIPHLIFVGTGFEGKIYIYTRNDKEGNQDKETSLP